MSISRRSILLFYFGRASHLLQPLAAIGLCSWTPPSNLVDRWELSGNPKDCRWQGARRTANQSTDQSTAPCATFSLLPVRSLSSSAAATLILLLRNQETSHLELHARWTPISLSSLRRERCVRRYPRAIAASSSRRWRIDGCWRSCCIVSTPAAARSPTLRHGRPTRTRALRLTAI